MLPRLPLLSRLARGRCRPRRPISAIRQHSGGADAPARPLRPSDFALDRIDASSFPPWLLGEMRSNQAGETGAVAIYQGSGWALGVRERWLGDSDNRAPSRAVGDGDGDSVSVDISENPGAPGGPAAPSAAAYEAALASFVREHVESERAHLVLLDVILCDASMRSRLLPVWRLAGFALGAVSTLLSPRRMYVTTDAVETFVEGHYQYQIGRLEGTSRVEGRAESERALSHDAAVESHDYHDDRGREELLRVLRHCCEDEVHHKEEAQAAYGTLRPTDVPWQWLVGRGSAVAASAAKLL